MRPAFCASTLSASTPGTFFRSSMGLEAAVLVAIVDDGSSDRTLYGKNRFEVDAAGRIDVHFGGSFDGQIDREVVDDTSQICVVCLQPPCPAFWPLYPATRPCPAAAIARAPLHGIGEQVLTKRSLSGPSCMCCPRQVPPADTRPRRAMQRSAGLEASFIVRRILARFYKGFQPGGVEAGCQHVEYGGARSATATQEITEQVLTIEPSGA